MTESERFDVAVIGGGPAGLTAALYAARAKLRVVIFEENQPGGQMARAHRIDNYPGFAEGITGVALATAMHEQVRLLGAGLVTERVELAYPAGDDFAVSAGGSEYAAAAVIIATGTDPRRKPVPGEAELVGRGVSYCATCDGFFFQDQEVAVVGGCPHAVKEAIFLTRFCRTIHLFHDQPELAVDDELRSELQAQAKIRVHLDCRVQAVRGDQKVTGLAVAAAGTGSARELPVAGVFFLTGQESRTRMLADLVDRDERGLIVTGAGGATRTPGIWAAGDVVAGSIKQVVTAAAAGAHAAIGAIAYLQKKKR